MTRLPCCLAISLALALTACGPAEPGIPASTLPALPTDSATAPLPGTISAGTAQFGTTVPVFITDLPPDFTPPPSEVPPSLTPIPPLPGGLGPTELKYRVLAQFPDIFFCDPDFYPVARADEMDLARQRFPDLQANAEEFSTILAHNNLAGLATFTDDHKLLIYREHKKLAAIQFELTAAGYRFQLQVADNQSNGELLVGLIDSQGAITVQQRNPSIATCPICLAAGTLIDTPGGPVPVTDLRLGRLVWTVNAAGARIAAPIIQISKTIVPAAHQVIHIRLNDGRELWASPGHPTADGRTIGDLRAGDGLDRATVTLAERVAYQRSATYDVLPAGDTGFYWADEILIGSTLFGQ